MKQRVKMCGEYWFISPVLEIRSAQDTRNYIDNPRYECGNYFLTRKEAEAAAKKIRTILNE